MQPNTQINSNLIKRVIAILIVLTLVIALPLVWYANFTFHITGTNPKPSNVGVSSPYLKVNFSQKLDGDSLHYTTTGGNFVQSVSVNEKTVTFNLSRNLSKGKKYSITIQSIANMSGKKITNEVFAFTAKELTFDQLSKGEQEDLNKQQDNIPYSVGTISFVGFDSLADSGLSINQLVSVKNAVFGLSKQLGEEFSTVTLKQDTLYPGPVQDTSTIDFDFIANDKTYHAKVSYTGFDDPITVFTNTSGQEIYRDSPEVMDSEE